MESIENLDVQCEVDWKPIWKSISEYLTIFVWIMIPVSISIRYLKSGFDYSKTFENMSPLALAVMMLALPVIIPLFMLLIVPFIKALKVSIQNGYLYGRDHSMKKRKISLNEIQEISELDNNGISLFVVRDNNDQKIQVLNTESMSEVLELLFLFLEQNSSEQKTNKNT